jgi:NDP-sugar pyrophosphorylase family protein
MIHEMVDVDSTEEQMKKSYTQVGEHLYAKTGELEIKSLNKKEKRELQVVMMMGGGGTRMLHRTGGKISKHMIEVGGKPISKFTVDLWKSGGFTDFCFLIDSTEIGKSIQRFYDNTLGQDVKKLYSMEERKLGSGGAIKQAIDNGIIRTSFINHFPDDQIVGYPNFAEDFAKIFVAAMKAGYHAVVVCTPGTLYPYGEVVDKDGKVVDFIEKPFIAKDSNTGVFALSKESFDLLKGLNIEAGPVKIERTVLRKLAQDGKVFKILLPSEYWIPVNDEPNFQKFEILVNSD